MTSTWQNSPEWLRTRRYLIVTMKYVVAVLISLHVTGWFGVVDFLSASFVSVLTLQPNLYRGLRWSWFQLLATTLGATVTVIILLASGGDLLTDWWTVQAALAMGATILLCLWWELGDGTTIAIFTVAYLTCLPQMIPGQDFWQTFHLRYATILIGITTATLINYGSSLFRYRDRLRLSLGSILNQYRELLEFLLGQLDEFPDPSDRALRKIFREFRNLFESVHDLERDIEQLYWEANQKLSRLDVTTVQQNQTCLIQMKNVTHHSRSLVLELLDRSVTEQQLQQLSEALSLRVDYLKRLSEIFTGGGSIDGIQLLEPPDDMIGTEKLRLMDDSLKRLEPLFRERIDSRDPAKSN